MAWTPLDGAHWAVNQFGLRPDDIETYGEYQQTETAMFQVWTDIDETEVGANTTLTLRTNMQSLFDIDG